ncbi:MAG: hypothetical protein MZW92_54605 [Comamonadaceae bacterium]|nr:hypothetical protein [Comamonadaceae bacterium]
MSIKDLFDVAGVPTTAGSASCWPTPRRPPPDCAGGGAAARRRRGAASATPT